MKFQCISSIFYPCISCSSNYYEKEIVSIYKETQNFLNKNCYEKNYNSSNISIKILVLNSECNNCNILNYNFTFYQLELALLQIHEYSIINLSGSIEFYLQKGTHYLLRKNFKNSDSEFFRKSLFEIKFKTFNNEKVYIKIKTNEFFFFISNIFTIENIIFEGLEISFQTSNNHLSCYNLNETSCCENNEICYYKFNDLSTNKQNYGFFNLEKLLDINIVPHLNLFNCSFINFINVFIDKGFSSIFVLSPIISYLTLENISFENSFSPKGVILIENNVFYNILTLDEIKKFKENENENSKIFLKNVAIKNYNQMEFNFINIENDALFKMDNFMGEIYIEQILIENIKKTKYLFHVINSPFFKFYINNSTLKYLRESSILQIDVGLELIFDGLIIKNNNTIIYDFLLELKNIRTIILNNTIILDFLNEGTDLFNIYSSNLLILNSLFQNSIIYTLFKGVDSTFNIENSTFKNIKFQKYLIKSMNSLIFIVKNSYFTKIEGDSSLIYLTAIDLVDISNTTFFRISSLLVLDFDYIVQNNNNFLILIENKANYFWLNDPKINYISINSSLILRNYFVTALFSNFGVSINFILFDTYISENNSTGFALFNVFYTKLTLINMVLIKNYLISDKLSDSVMSVQDKCTLYVENSYFENNGIPFLKIYYVALTHNAFFGFYDVKIAKFINNKFILTGLINQISGILNGLPLGNELFLEKNKFILLNPNDKYEYKGLMIQATPRVLFKNNFFFGLECNKRSFQHIHGAILFESDLPSYKYKKNSYTIELDGDKYINCNCWKGGTISILGIKEIKIKNCLFFNSTSEDFGGHMSVIGGEFNTFINNTFQYSRAKNGGCLLFWSIAQVIMSENKIYNSHSIGNGNIFVKEVIEFILNFTIFDNIFASSNGGCLYLFQSNAFVQNVTINNSQAIGKGGSFYLESFSSLKLLNSTIVNNIANEGGCLYINNANTLILNNIFSFNNTSEKKGGFIYSSLIEIFTLQNINIIKNYCNQVGIIFISCEKEDSIFYISNMTCLKNKANEGSCIYYIAISKLFLNNITCIENYENVISFYWPFEINIYLNLILIKDSYSLSNFISFSGVKIELVNLKIYQCISKKYLIDSSESKLFIKYSNIFNVSSLYLIYSIKSEINFNDIILTNTLNKSTSLLDSINSKIECRNITVTNSSFLFVIKMIYGNLIIENCLFLNNNFCLISLSLVNANISFSTFNNVNKDSIMPNDLLFEESLVDSYNILIFSCLFNVFNHHSIELKGKINFILKNSSFLSNNIHQTSSILFYNLLNIIIMNSYFLNFTNSAIQIISTNKINNQTFDFLQNSYINNKGECGGSINAKGDFSLNFINNSFENNIANLFNSSKKCRGVGGSIFFIGFDSDNNFLNLTKNKFENNFADLQGPNSFSTVKTFNNENSFINCSDQNNFTNHLFSYPIQLNLYNKTKVISFRSGNKFELNLILTDYFHQKLIFDKSSIFIIKNLENPKLKILITSPIGVINSGNIIFKDLIINSLSDELFNLTIEGNFVDIGQTTLISLKIEFYSEKCPIGSIIKSDLSCFMCPLDFYSFILPTNENSGVLNCIYCPSNSYCYGSNLVFPIKGYYRKNNITIDPVECINIEACEGGLYNSNELKNINYEYFFFGNCKEGNFGNLCYNCLEGYGKFEEKDACLKCEDNNLMIYFRLVGILMFISFYLIIGSRFEEDLNKNKTTSERLRVIIRAIISHNQQILIIFSNINIFPIFSLKSYFNVLESITFLNENAVNNDCIIFSSFTVESIFILKKVLILLIPLFCSFLTLFVHYTILCFYNYFVKKENKILINLQDILLNLEFFFLFSVFLFYPLMLKSSFDFLNCIKLDKNENEYYLRINPNIECFQSKHNQLLFFIGFPGIIVYGIGYPLLLYFSLKKIYKTKSNLITKENQSVNKSVASKFSESEIKRKSQILSKSSEKSTKTFSFSSKRVFTIKIQDSSIIQSQKIKRLSKFSFFHKDMNEEYFYWQSIILLRKFFLTFISTLNEIISQEMRYFFIVIICLIFIFPMVKFNPFKFKNENSIEIISLSICVFAALCCIVLNSNSDDIFKLIISLFFFIFNIIFMAYLGYILANLIKDFCNKKKITKIIRKSQKSKIALQSYKFKFKS